MKKELWDDTSQKLAFTLFCMSFIIEWEKVTNLSHQCLAKKVYSEQKIKHKVRLILKIPTSNY